ncbi:phosphotransferase family protein [Undibacterium sp. Di24W]|uniref:phosphotransferase family protein n=1 Tax=Undibacterium sp. Di24W TaxID=3413033 RepID=UPI003BF18967
MFFTASNLVHYLLSRNLIQLPSVVDGEFKVIEAGQRNRNFKVMRDARSGLFVKQVKTLDSLSKVTLQREVACYQFAQAFPAWVKHIPRLIDHDIGRHSLCLELFVGAENLSEYFNRCGALSVEVASLLGTVMASYHDAVALENLQPDQLQQFRQQIPWILSFTEAPAGATGGAIAFIDFLNKNAELPRNLQGLRQTWRVDRIIHGDMKWDNCLVFLDADGTLQLKIIDWELLDLGDACWDVAGILQAYLVHLIKSTVLTEFKEEDAFNFVLKKADIIFPSIRAFWNSYCSTMRIPAAETDALFLRCVEFAAARLVLTAFEWSCQLTELTKHSQIMLLLSHQILLDPARSVCDLFGLTQDHAEEIVQ